MTQKKQLTVVAVCILIGILYTSVYAVRLLTKKVALKKMLPEAETVVEEKRKMTPAEKELSFMRRVSSNTSPGKIFHSHT